MTATKYTIHFPAYIAHTGVETEWAFAVSGQVIPCQNCDYAVAFKPVDQSSITQEALFGPNQTTNSSLSDHGCSPWTSTYSETSTGSVTYTRLFTKFALLNRTITRSDYLFDITVLLVGASSTSSTYSGCCTNSASSSSTDSGYRSYVNNSPVSIPTLIPLDPQGFIKNCRKDIFIIARKTVTTTLTDTYESSWEYRALTSASTLDIVNTTVWEMSYYDQQVGTGAYKNDTVVYLRFIMGGKLYEAKMPYGMHRVRTLSNTGNLSPPCLSNTHVTNTNSDITVIDLLPAPLINPTSCTDGTETFAIYGWFPTSTKLVS